MFRACPALLQSDSAEGLELKVPVKLDAKNPRFYLPCGNSSHFASFTFSTGTSNWHDLIRRQNAYLRRVLIAFVLIPGIQEQVYMAECSSPMLMSKNTVDAADMGVTCCIQVAGLTSDAASCLDFGMENAIFPSSGTLR
jgi:hypothetical protein